MFFSFCYFLVYKYTRFFAALINSKLITIANCLQQCPELFKVSNSDWASFRLTCQSDLLTPADKSTLLKYGFRFWSLNRKGNTKIDIGMLNRVLKPWVKRFFLSQNILGYNILIKIILKRKMIDLFTTAGYHEIDWIIFYTFFIKRFFQLAA